MKKRRKMVLWILLATPVVLILLAAVVGTFLPETYAAKGRITCTLAPGEVWARLHDPKRFPMSGRMCRGVEVLPTENGRAVWTEDIGSSQLRIHHSEADQPKRLLRLVEDTKVPFTARAEFTIEPRDTGSVLTCTNTATVRSGTWHVPFFRVMIGLFGGAKSGCKDYLTRLAGETGRDFAWVE
ncbi:MAG: hypothetical protein H6837_03405 [Planctomycetes bacterium]|nr:hypothetical protein [Planctomycetota bacterium]